MSLFKKLVCCDGQYATKEDLSNVELNIKEVNNNLLNTINEQYATKEQLFNVERNLKELDYNTGNNYNKLLTIVNELTEQVKELANNNNDITNSIDKLNNSFNNLITENNKIHNLFQKKINDKIEEVDNIIFEYQQNISEVNKTIESFTGKIQELLDAKQENILYKQEILDKLLKLEEISNNITNTSSIIDKIIASQDSLKIEQNKLNKSLETITEDNKLLQDDINDIKAKYNNQFIDINEKLDSFNTKFEDIEKSFISLKSNISTDTNNTVNLTDISDLTNIFKEGNSVKINAELTKNKNKVIYVAPGNYIVDGTIIIPEVKEFYCFGNLIGPDNVNKIKTVCGNSKIKAVVYSSKQNVNIYINTITVRHNYTGLYCNGNLCHITVKQIVGEYSEDICPLIDTNMYEQIPDNWYLNQGLTIDNARVCIYNIGRISGFNVGISFRTSLIKSYQSIYNNIFNVDIISAKTAILMDRRYAIIENNGEYSLTKFVNQTNLKNSFIHGNIFNINIFDDQLIDGRTKYIACKQTKPNNLPERIILQILDGGEPYGSNKFYCPYWQGKYDKIIDCINSENIYLYGEVTVQDVYLDAAQNKRNTGTVTADDVMVNIQNSYNIELNFDKARHLRYSEINVDDKSRNIYINNVMVEGRNTWHVTNKNNFNQVRGVIYDLGEIYKENPYRNFSK